MPFLILTLLMAFSFEGQYQCSFPPKMKYTASGLTFFQMPQIEGEAVLSLIGTKEENGKVVEVCLGLYDELNLQLIATAKTDKDGRFTFDNIKPGIYRLISKAPAYHSVNVPVRVYDSRKIENKQKARLILHLRFLKDERSSFATMEGKTSSL